MFVSIVLMAVVDYNYKSLYVNVGCQGRISDGGVFKNTDLYNTLERKELGIPAPRPLPRPNGDTSWEEDVAPCPFVFVADEAFSLTHYCMKPYAQRQLTDEKRIFNYRLSRFRRVTENAFGIWANRFRLFLGRCNLSPDKACVSTLASLALHNMLCTKSSNSYVPPGFIDTIMASGEIEEGSWRNENIYQCLTPFANTLNRHHNASAAAVREKLAKYFVGPGSVPWQWKCLV